MLQRSGIIDESAAPLSTDPAEVVQRRAAVLEGEHVVAWVIGGTEQFPFAALPLASSTQRGKGGPVNRYRFVGVASLPPALSRAWPPTTTRLSWTVISPVSRSTPDHLGSQM